VRKLEAEEAQAPFGRRNTRKAQESMLECVRNFRVPKS
jgi:hypothetical protein